MKIYLIGFMASGKTTVGLELAKILGYRFVDLDEYIETKQGRSIKLLFEIKGEEYFRMVEQDALKEVASFDGDYVISSGGGTSCFYNSVDFMNNTGMTVYLRMEVATLVARLIDSKINRPLLWGKTKEELNNYIIRVLDERKKFYEKAQIVMDADRLNPGDLAQTLKEIIRGSK
ncbi:MAG: shikimate kinase [Bacteroidales bacterium]|nr:shikimate kinase [Bacteroidales bacterium]